jgi:hypothetical protein
MIVFLEIKKQKKVIKLTFFIFLRQKINKINRKINKINKKEEKNKKSVDN